MKKKTIILWIGFVICVVMAVILRFAMDSVDVEYEEVEVKVLSSVTNQLKNKKNGSTYNFYEVKVEYNGKTYDLENAHSTYEYPKGKNVKAYLSNDKIYADINGIKTSTPVAIAYFVFLFGSIIMLFVASMNTGKAAQSKSKDSKTEE